MEQPGQTIIDTADAAGQRAVVRESAFAAAARVPDPAGKAARFPAADLLRAFAALWVCLFHARAGLHVETLVHAIPDSAARIVFDAGHLGVAVFFVLSGLVIALAGSRCGDSLASARGFVLRRLVRLCPPYHVSILVVLAALALKRGVEGGGAGFPSAGDVGLHLLFLQDIAGIKPLNTVYWTLCIEVQFYLVFCVLMLAIHALQRRLPSDTAFRLVMGAACAVAALWPLGIGAGDARWHATFLPTWHLFLLGALLGFIVTGRRAAIVPFAIYLPCLLGAAAVRADAFTLAGLATALVLMAAFRWGRGRFGARWSWLTRIGLISYSLYLLHNTVTGITFNVTRRVLGTGTGAELAGLAASLGLCLLAAAICYRFVERPAIAWSRRVGR